MTDRMWIALAAVVFLIAAVGFCVWWFLPPRADFDPDDFEQIPWSEALAADDTDEQWADELHQMNTDLPGRVAPAPAAGEHHCGICGLVHDDDTRLDPDWFGRWELEQAEWMAGFHRDRDAFNEWLAAA